jgi:hypothetical protein
VIVRVSLREDFPGLLHQVADALRAISRDFGTDAGVECCKAEDEPDAARLRMRQQGDGVKDEHSQDRGVDGDFAL